MSITVRNKTSPAVDVPLDDLSITISASADVSLLRISPDRIAASVDLPAAITAGDLVVLDPIDGSTELSVADSNAAVSAANDTHWRLGAGSRIGDISDVDLTGVADGDALTFDTGSGNWIATDPDTFTSGDDLAGVVVGRTTTQAISNGSFGTINWDVTNFENNTSIISHDPATNNSRLTISETGVYQIFFSVTAQPTAATVTFLARVIKNGVTTALAGSEREVNEDDEANDISNVFLASLTAGDFLEFQLQADAAGTTMLAKSTFGAMRVRGSKGDQGPAGSGSTITVEDEGTIVGGGPHSILNFVGDNVAATDAGGGQANITISSGSNANDAVLGRRTTALTLTTAFQDVTFDSTTVETDATVIEHNNTNTDDFDIKETGTYLIMYQFNILVITTGNDTITADARLRLNDTSVIVGSLASQGAFNDSSIEGENAPAHLSASTIANLTAGDKITLQVRKTEIGGTGQFDLDELCIRVIRLL